MNELYDTDSRHAKANHESCVSWCGFHFETVICDKKNCDRCGWHPAVEKERKMKLRKEFEEDVR